HQLEVIREDGVYRHLSYREPQTSVYAVEVVTWPYHLALSGDMGSRMFRHYSEHDMLRLFYRPEGSISPDYWAKKQAVRSPSEKFSPVLAQEWVNEQIGEWIAERPELAPHEADIRRAVRWSVVTDRDESVFLSSIHDFEYHVYDQQH